MQIHADIIEKHKVEVQEQRAATTDANKLKVAAQNEVAVKQAALQQAQSVRRGGLLLLVYA